MSMLSVPACLTTAQLTAFMNGVKNNRCCEAVAKKLFFSGVLTALANISHSSPEHCTALKSRKWAGKEKHRFPICSLPAFSWAIIWSQICDYSWQGLFISWETSAITQCFCRECQPPGERAFQIWFFFFFFKYVSNCFFTVWSLPFNDSYFYLVSFQHRPCPPSQYYNPPRSHPLCQVTQGEIVKDENPFCWCPVQMFCLRGLRLGGCRNYGHGSQKT